MLDHARKHLTRTFTSTVAEPIANIQAISLLANLSLIVFPDQEIKIRRGGL